LLILQFLLTAAASFALWQLWRVLAGNGRASTIIAVGFLLRALGGQVLFWISFLKLPIGESLQIGDGFWFFALDGRGYLAYATYILAGFTPGDVPSPLFVHFVMAFAAMFGGVASIAILLNAFAYLLTCALILRLSPRNLVPLTAMAFGPSAILWSLQLLKDTLFTLLLACMVAVWHRWEVLWRIVDRRRIQLASCALAMLAIGYALANIRWYVGAFVWAASSVFFILVLVPVRPRAWALVTSGVVLALLNQAVGFGAGGDLPTVAIPFFRPRPAIAAKWRASSATKYTRNVRRRFENTRGATTIASGPALSDEARPAPAEPEGPSVSSAPASQSVAPRLTTGLVAAFLPKFLGEGLGLVNIGGGRGYWLFAELDTIVFDLLILFALFTSIRALRQGRRPAALFVMLMLVLVMTALPMVYSVTNFGTLFRLRQMLYFLVAMLTIDAAFVAREETTR